MKKVTTYIIMGFMSLFVAAPALAVTTSLAPAAMAAPAKEGCNTRVLGIPTWYRGVTNSDCSIKTPSGGEAELSEFIWKIVLNIVEMALVIVVYIAVGFVIYGGFLFMTGGGNPSQLEKARKSITNALVGLVISMSAIALTNFIFRII